MKTHRTPNRRALAALVPATLLLAMPAVAQEAQTVTPPPVAAAPAAPPPQAVAPPRVVPTLPAAQAPEPTAEPATVASAPAARRAVRRAPAPAPVGRARPVAPVAAAPAAEPAQVPAPQPVAEAAAPPVAPNPAPVHDTPVETTATTTDAAPIWPLIVGGLLVLAGLAIFLLRRRRRTDDDVYEDADYAEPVYAEPVAVAPIAADPAPRFLRPATIEPAAIEPVTESPAFVPTAAQAEQTASEDLSLAKADADDVAALTTADAPVTDRPWLEFAMRPVRAGTNVDEALVEIELTIGNSGSVAAKDVRVSTFMFASGPGEATGMERELLDRSDDHGVPPVTIAPGEGTRVDATLALPRAELTARAGDSFSPVVVADARYTLPDGSEGRTSASFRIGLNDERGSMNPFLIEERAMHEDVEAELYGTPEHA